MPFRRRWAPAPSVSVVIPTLNEAGSLPWVLENLPPSISEVVLVDGLSTDETEVIARTLLTDVVVVHQPQRGKGAALRAGFAAASGDIIVMIDADGSTDPREIDLFVRALENGADFVKGSRHMACGGSDDFTPVRRAGNGFFVNLVNLIYGSDFTDLCYGYCAFWRGALDAMPLRGVGFEIETELVLSAVNAGLKISEVPSHELCRRAGTSNLNAIRDGRRVLRTIMEERPARRLRRPTFSPDMTLVPVELAEPGSDKWVPAGSEQRRNDRRRTGEQDAAYGGEDRRVSDRRVPPSHTVTVYRVVQTEQPAEVASLIAA